MSEEELELVCDNLIGCVAGVFMDHLKTPCDPNWLYMRKEFLKALREADSNANIKAYLNAARMFNRYTQAATKEEVYAYSRCEMYCLGMAQEVAKDIRELEKNG